MLPGGTWRGRAAATSSMFTAARQPLLISDAVTLRPLISHCSHLAPGIPFGHH